MSEFNPIYEVCGLKMTLTEICHGEGMKGQMGKKGKARKDAYYNSYFSTLRKFYPNHPSLLEKAE